MQLSAKAYLILSLVFKSSSETNSALGSPYHIPLGEKKKNKNKNKPKTLDLRVPPTYQRSSTH